jgi:hypothetical protein
MEGARALPGRRFRPLNAGAKKTFTFPMTKGDTGHEYGIDYCLSRRGLEGRNAQREGHFCAEVVWIAGIICTLAAFPGPGILTKESDYLGFAGRTDGVPFLWGSIFCISFSVLMGEEIRMSAGSQRCAPGDVQVEVSRVRSQFHEAHRAGVFDGSCAPVRGDARDRGICESANGVVVYDKRGISDAAPGAIARVAGGWDHFHSDQR